MSTNKALTIMEPGKIEVLDCSIPEINEEEVLIEVHYVAVCGSDVKLYAGSYTAPHKYPIVIGHEWLGKVVKTGAASKNQVGDMVVGDCSVFCGECYYCNYNKNHCEVIEKRGITVDGGAARYIAINQKHVTKCIDLDDEKLLTLTEPMSVAVNGLVNRVPQEVFDRTRSALILGCGGIGMMSLFTLMEYQIPEIVMIDISKEKVDLINGFGIKQVTAICADATKLLGLRNDGFDLIVEATGHTESLQKTTELANPCAHIVCLGHQKAMEYDFGTVVKKSLTIHASNGSTGGFAKSMEIIRRNRLFVAQMVTDVVPLSKAVAYFEEELLRKSNIKVLIDFSC